MNTSTANAFAIHTKQSEIDEQLSREAAAPEKCAGNDDEKISRAASGSKASLLSVASLAIAYVFSIVYPVVRLWVRPAAVLAGVLLGAWRLAPISVSWSIWLLCLLPLTALSTAYGILKFVFIKWFWQPAWWFQAAICLVTSGNFLVANITWYLSGGRIWAVFATAFLSLASTCGMSQEVVPISIALWKLVKWSFGWHWILGILVTVVVFFFWLIVLNAAARFRGPPSSEFFNGFGPVELSEEEFSGDSRVIDETVGAVLEANDYYELFQLDIPESQIMGKTYDFSSDDFRHRVRRAGRKLKLKCHPDKSSGSPGANVAFQRVQEAEGVLLDDEKRTRYNELYISWKLGNGPQLDNAESKEDNASCRPSNSPSSNSKPPFRRHAKD